MLKRVFLLGAAALLGQAACLGSYDKSVPSSVVDNDKISDEQPAVRPVMPEDSTSLWMQYGDPAVLAARAAEEGPLDVSSRQHACHKFKFHTLGQVMLDLGVNMTAPTTAATTALLPLELALRGVTDANVTCLNYINPNKDNAIAQSGKIAQPARFLYCASRLTLGLPAYGSRLSESTQITTAGATKQFDTLAAAAIEIANRNLQDATRCADSSGTKAVLFDTVGTTVTCNPDGVACLQGYMPSNEQLNLCNRLLTSGEATNAGSMDIKFEDTSTGSIPPPVRTITVAYPGVTAVDAGKRLAAASVLANALLCE